VRPALDVISHLRLGGILNGSTPDTAVQREVRRDYLNATPGGDQYGLVLPKGSALTAPVTQAVDALRADGTLDSLVKTWLTDSVNVPVLS